MINLKNIEYKKMYLIDQKKILKGLEERIILTKSFFKDKQKDQYFVNLFKLDNNRLINMGYLYFYINDNFKKASYIGSYIKEEYRNMGYSTLLVSYFIKLCLDNEIENIDTTKHQRKPFLLYTLKTFSFEIESIDEYINTLLAISICSKNNCNTKFLYFLNEKFRNNFMRGTIYKTDNYQMIDKITSDYKELDKVILSRIYTMKNQNYAYQKSLNKIDLFKNKGDLK